MKRSKKQPACSSCGNAIKTNASALTADNNETQVTALDTSKPHCLCYCG